MVCFEKNVQVLDKNYRFAEICIWNSLYDQSYESYYILQLIVLSRRELQWPGLKVHSIYELTLWLVTHTTSYEWSL